jgi:heme/copper-type cytochrome/quinol oxidase subunit 2
LIPVAAEGDIVTEFAKSLADANVVVLWSCVGIAIIVFALMLCSIAAFRRAPAEAAQIRGTTAEVLWAIVPIAIVIAMAAPAVKGILATGAHAGAMETAQQQPAAAIPPAAATQIPQKTFHEGAVPL